MKLLFELTADQLWHFMRSNDDFFIYFDIFYVFKLTSTKISVFYRRKKFGKYPPGKSPTGKCPTGK